MGYCTDLYGGFYLDRKLSDLKYIFLKAFHDTRHYKRDVTKLGFPKDFFGTEGEFYFCYPEEIINGNKKILVNENDPLYKYYTFPESVDKGILKLDGSNVLIGPSEWDKYGIIDLNKPAGSCPSLYCPWMPNEDGSAIIPDGCDKPYEYVNWIVFLYQNFLENDHYILNGTVEWQGEKYDDFGKIVIINNDIQIYKGVRDYKELNDNELKDEYGLIVKEDDK